MRIQLVATFPLIVILGCGQTASKVTSAQAPPGGTAAADPVAAGGEALAGTVVEKIDASQYTYLRLQGASGEAWAAVPKSDIAVGSQVRVVNAMWMENFKSTTMNRTWPRIAFGVLEVPANTAVVGSSAGPVADAPMSIARATGKNARTIAEVYAQKDALKDQVVRVRGQVVKETDQVMGKNWIHLRDGTGQGALGDLAFASDDTAAVGQTVLLDGVVHLNRDLGAGYHYDVLIEDAHLEKE